MGVLAALIALLALGCGVFDFILLGLMLTHYNPSGAESVMQLSMALFGFVAIIVLAAQFAIKPESRPRMGAACGLLICALLSTALLTASPPVASFILLLFAITLGGGAWIAGARAVRAS